MSKLAVVILNWNGENLLKEFLPSVVENSKYPGVEIVVADNASTDRSLDVLKSEFPSVKVILLDQNYGFTGGYNRSLKQVDAEYVVLLNSDVAPAAGWIEPLIKELDENPNTAVCVPKIKSYRNKDCFEYAGAAGGYIDKYGFVFCRGRIFNDVEKDLGQYNQSSDVFWASGAAMMIRKDLYFELGGLDEDFFAHMEEIDLCWRLKNRGWNIRYIANSEVFHLGGATLDYDNPTKVFLNFRNNLFLLVKNLPHRKFVIKLLQRMLLDGVAGLKFILSGEFKNFYSVLLAHFSFYSKFGLMYRKRKENLKYVKVSCHKEMYPHSVVAQFFIHRKTNFSQLSKMYKMD